MTGSWKNGIVGTGRSRFVLVVFVMAAATGCSDVRNDAVAIVRDSVGVVIVESREPGWRPGDEWRLSDVPLLDIGTADGMAAYQFHRVEGVLRMGNGVVVVGDGGSGELRFYDGEGRFLRSSGRQGDAPGEYRMISGLGAGPGDSLWVYDYGSGRFTVLTAEGEPVRTVSLGGLLSAPGAVGRFSDGSFLVREGWGRAAGGSIRTGLRRDPVALVVVAADGSSSDTLGMFPGREIFVSDDDGRAVMSTPLFGHNLSVAMRADEVFLGDQERLEVCVYAADGTLARIFRAPDADLRLSAADIAGRIEQVLSDIPGDRRAAARNQLEEMAVPDSRPAYGHLLVGGDGSLWAAEHTRYPAIPATWTVFAADGGLLGDVAMPDRFRPFQIGEDWVVGVGLDDLDVEHVRLYRLEK